MTDETLILHLNHFSVLLFAQRSAIDASTLPFIALCFLPRRHSHHGDNKRHEYVLSFCPRRIGQSFLRISTEPFPGILLIHLRNEGINHLCPPYI